MKDLEIGVLRVVDQGAPPQKITIFCFAIVRDVKTNVEKRKNMKKKKLFHRLFCFSFHKKR